VRAESKMVEQLLGCFASDPSSVMMKAAAEEMRRNERE
jgi:hypothetical protein